MRTDHTRVIELRSYHRRRTRHLIEGRSAHGTPWRRTPTLLPWERRERQKAQNLAKHHRRAKRRVALGLNSRGKPYKTLVMYRAWQWLKEGMAHE